jgi:hypothetical protein
MSTGTTRDHWAMERISQAAAISAEPTPARTTSAPNAPHCYATSGMAASLRLLCRLADDTAVAAKRPTGTL